jgi:hypothetical protein
MNNKGKTKNDWAHDITETSSPIIGATGINPMTQDLLHIGVRVIDSSGKERMVHPFWGIRGLNNALEQFVGTEEKQQQEQPDNATTWRRLLEENQIHSNDAPEKHYNASTGEWVILSGDETLEELEDMSVDSWGETEDDNREWKQANEAVSFLEEMVKTTGGNDLWETQFKHASQRLRNLEKNWKFSREDEDDDYEPNAWVYYAGEEDILEKTDELGRVKIEFRNKSKPVRPKGWVFNPAWKTDKIHQPKFLPPGAMVQKTSGCNPGRGICNCGSLTPTQGYINADNGEFVPHYKKWKVKNLVHVTKKVWSKKWNCMVPKSVPAKVVRNIRNYGTEKDPRTGRKRAKTHKDACWFQPSFGVKQHKAKVIEFAAPTTVMVDLFDVEAQGKTTDVKAEAEESAGEARAYGAAVATISLF